MLKKKNSLPRAERWFPANDRNDLACAGDCHTQMACRIVRSLQSVSVSRIVFWRDSFKPRMQVGPRALVRIFEYDETGACVADKDRCCPGRDPGGADNLLDVRGYFIGSLAGRSHGKPLVDHRKRSWLHGCYADDYRYPVQQFGAFFEMLCVRSAKTKEKSLRLK